MKKEILFFFAFLLSFSLASAIPISSCQTISISGNYELTQDLVSDATCIIINANNVNFDLMGHTITFSNKAPITISNPGFESGSGTNADNWDQSGYPSAIRTTEFTPAIGSWVPEQLGTYTMKLPAGTSGQYIYSDYIDVIPNQLYQFSALVYDSEYIGDYSVAGSPLDLKIIDENDNTLCNVIHARYSDDWGAHRCYTSGTGYRFSSPTSRIRIVAGMAASSTHDFFIDDFRIGEVGDLSGTSEHFGVKISSGRTNIVVKNGSIIEGQSGAFSTRGVFLGSGSTRELSELNINVHSPESFGIYAGSNSGNTFHDSVIIQLSDRTHDSHDGTSEGAIDFSGCSDNEVYNMNITSSSGIIVEDGSLRTEIHNSRFNITSTGIHRYAVAATGWGSRTRYTSIHDNFINNSQGGGFFLESGSLDGIIYNNYVEVRDGPQEERGWIGKGIWARDLDGNGMGNYTIFNNTFIGYAGQDLIRPGTNSRMSVVRIGGGPREDADGPFYFYDNYVEAITNLQSSDTWAIAMDLTTDQHPGVTKYIYNNTFKSNDILVAFGGVGVYGYTYGAGDRNLFTSNTLIKASDMPTGAHTIYYGTGWDDSGTAWGGTNNKMLDTTVSGGADVHDIHYASTYGLRDLNISWYLDIRATDGISLLGGADVEIRDANNNLVVDTQTQSGQILRNELIEQHIEGTGTNIDYTNYSPYNITLTYNSETQSRIVTLDESKTETFTFAGSGCVPGSTLQNAINSWFLGNTEAPGLVAIIKSWFSNPC